MNDSNDLETNDDNIELLEYKFEEVLRFHTSDFGKSLLSQEKIIEFNANITDPTIDKLRIYKDIIRTSYILLINANLKEIEDNIKSIKRKTVDFSEINKGIKGVRNKLKNTQPINNLIEIYTNDIDDLKISLQGKRSSHYNSIIWQILIAIVSLFVGIVLQKEFNVYSLITFFKK